MPSDAEMLARLEMLTEMCCKGARILTGDQTVIRWAVKRIGELEGAMRSVEPHIRHQRWCRETKGYDDCACGMWKARQPFDAALSPAPAKEGGPHA